MSKKTIAELTKNEEERALELHKKAIIIDALTGCAGCDSSDPEFANNRMRFQIEKLIEGGSTANCLGVKGNNFVQCVQSINSWDMRFARAGIKEKVLRVLTANDIKKAKKEGRVGYINNTQSAWCLEFNPSNVDALWNIGLRILQLTYQWANLIGDGCGSRRARYAGLTDFGVLVVERMNKVGMLIDLSHCGYKTTMDVIEISKDPIAFTHTNVKAINDMLRCKNDEELKAVAETGGIIGITGIARFIRKNAPKEGATIEHFLDHIDYVANLVGSDHVGIGLDMGEGKTEEMFYGVHKQLYNAKKTNKFWGWTTSAIWIPTGEDWPLEHYYPFSLDSYSKLLNITKGLVARGYSDKEILNILGQNWLNLFKRVWKG